MDLAAARRDLAALTRARAWLRRLGHRLDDKIAGLHDLIEAAEGEDESLSEARRILGDIHEDFLTAFREAMTEGAADGPPGRRAGLPDEWDLRKTKPKTAAILADASRRHRDQRYKALERFLDGDPSLRLACLAALVAYNRPLDSKGLANLIHQICPEYDLPEGDDATKAKRVRSTLWPLTSDKDGPPVLVVKDGDYSFRSDREFHDAEQECYGGFIVPESDTVPD